MRILNTIPTFGNIMDMNRMLIGRDVSPTLGSLSGHSRWSYVNGHFTLRQRTKYNSPIYFGQYILSIHFGALVSRDRKRNNMIMN